MESKLVIKKLLSRASFPKKIGAAMFAMVGVIYYVYALINRTVAVKDFFSSLLIILVILAVIEGLIFLSDFLLVKNSKVTEGVVDSFKGIGNGKLIVVKVDGKKFDGSYYKRRTKGLYVGSDVYVVERCGAFYTASYPVIFPR